MAVEAALGVCAPKAKIKNEMVALKRRMNTARIP